MLSASFSHSDPERLSLAKLFCGARFLFDHRVHDGEHARRNVEAERLAVRCGYAAGTGSASCKRRGFHLEVTKLPIMTDNIV